jgi:hypothetical protein
VNGATPFKTIVHEKVTCDFPAGIPLSDDLASFLKGIAFLCRTRRFVQLLQARIAVRTLSKEDRHAFQAPHPFRQ